MRTDTIVGYQYKAADYCPDHIVGNVLKHNPIIPAYWLNYISVEKDLAHLARILKVNNLDEHTYDSGDFPKVLFADQVVTSDSLTFNGHTPTDERDEITRCSVCGKELGTT